MIGAPDWLLTAYRELRAGVREVAGPLNHPRILAYHAATDGDATADEISWCSSFACWCMEDVSIRSPRSAWARSWLGWGARVSPVHPPLGAVLIFSRGPGPQPGPDVVAAPGHVGFFVGHAEPGVLLLLAGNQSDAVTISRYSVHQMLGARWPGE